jgi:serine/threonine protein kinase
MLTRTLPFDADSPVAIAMRHLHERPPAPSDVLPSIPPAVDAVILRSLDKDPTRRFPSAGAFARAMTYWRQYRAPTLRVGATEPGATAPLATPVHGASTRVLPETGGPAPPAPPGSLPPRAGPRGAGAAPPGRSGS